MHRLNFDYQNKPRTLTERRVKGETGLTSSLISQSQTGRVPKKAARRWTHRAEITGGIECYCVPSSFNLLRKRLAATITASAALSE
jgi:hypothetical protein